MSNMYCDSCNFKFKTRNKQLPKRCSYCGKEGTLKPVKNAQDWLNDVVTETS